MRWIEAGLGQPPILFRELLAKTVTDAHLLAEIDPLLEIKQRTGEAGYGPCREHLRAFIEHELARGEISPKLPLSATGKTGALDSLLYRTVMG